MNKKIVLGLGSNIGNRQDNIMKAIRILEDKNILRNIIVSDIFISSALLKENSPKEWNLEFYNIAVCGFTNYSPQDLLAQIKIIENEIGRIKRGRWAPREIDIDILAYAEEIFISENLIIPHKELLERDFVLIPFNQIWPEWLYPVKGKYFHKTIKYLTELLLKS